MKLAHGCARRRFARPSVATAMAAAARTSAADGPGAPFPAEASGPPGVGERPPVTAGVAVGRVDTLVASALRIPSVAVTRSRGASPPARSAAGMSTEVAFVSSATSYQLSPKRRARAGV